MNGRRILAETALLLMAAFLLATVSNLLRPETRKLAWIGTYAMGDRTPASSTSIRVPVAQSETPAQSASAGIGTAPGSPPRQRPSPATAEDPGKIAPPKDPALNYLAISGHDARRLHRAGALFVDARRSGDYENGHIAGARSIAVWEYDADDKVAALQKENLPFDTVIVAYCSGINCKDSAMLAEKLAAAGYYRVYVYEGGFPEWEKLDGPVRQGKTP